MRKILNEFREFAVKGNVIDLAVGVVVGGAFSKIVTSLVNDIIMPVVGMLTGGINFSEYKIYNNIVLYIYIYKGINETKKRNS